MGYESRIFVVQAPIDGCDFYGSEIARFDMCCMDSDFVGLFYRKIKHTLYGDSDADLTVDCYGNTCGYAHLDEVRDWLKEAIENGNNYRRLKPFLAFLETLDQSEWAREIQLIHYGY